jgi:predicted aspartyl protease
MDSLAITFRMEERAQRVITPVLAQQSGDYCRSEDLSISQFKADALWDTGSTGCCIDKALAERLGLSHYVNIGLRGSQGEHTVSAYILDITLPDGIVIKNVVAAGISTSGSFDIIIGMNIISRGDFALSNVDDKTIMSFRLPSANAPIDFSKEEIK